MAKNINFKLLSIDLDGTLLSKFKFISKKDLLSLQNYGNSGGHILINTGKSLESAYKYLKKIQRITNNIRYCSCLNGNLIYDLQTNEVIEYNSIPAEECKRIFDIVKKYKSRYMCYPIFVDEHKNPNLVEKSNVAILSKRILHILKYNRTKNPLIESSYKINMINYIKKINPEVVKEIEASGNVDVLLTNVRLFEIVKKGTNKGTSLNKIRNLYRFDKKDVASIGDSHNDLAMFEASGTSFLVNAKAPQDLKQVASVVVDVKKNKVAKVINNYVLKRVH